MQRARIHYQYITLLFFLLLLICLRPAMGRATEIGDILRQAKEQQAHFDENVQDMTIRQTAKTATPRGDSTMSITVMIKGRKFRMENTIRMPESERFPKGSGQVTTIVVSDGREAYVFSPFSGKQKLSAQERALLQTGAYWWIPYTQGARITGTEEVEGRQAWVVEIGKDIDSPFTKLWLDKTNLVPLKAEAAGPKGEPAVLYFSEFKEESPGYEVPYRTVTKMNGRVVSSVDVVEVRINQGLADTLFDPEVVEKDKGLR